MSSFKGLVARIEDYVGSEAWKEDMQTSFNARRGWVDVGFRFGLMSGCISVGDSEGAVMEIFGVMFKIIRNHIAKEELYQLKYTIQDWKPVIEKMYEIAESDDYKKLTEKKRGYIEFDRYSKDGQMGSKYLELKYDKSLVDYLFCTNVCVWGKDTLEDKIREINRIDDEMWKIGEMFCKSLPSIIYSRYFKMSKDPGTGKYCIKFDYSTDFPLTDVTKLAVLFNSRNKLYVDSVEELENMIGLVL